MNKLGKTSEERQKNFEEMVYLYNEKNLTLDDIGKRFNVSKQAINQFMVKRGFIPYKEKDIKFKRYNKMAKNTILEEKIKLFKREKENQGIYKTIAQKEAKKYKQALEEIKEMLKVSIETTNSDTHFEFVENAMKRVNEVLKDE